MRNIFRRDAEVLKDRDLSGELKDIWGAVQAKRLREKDSAPSYESYLASQNQVYIDFGPADVPPYQPEQQQQFNQLQNQNQNQQLQQQSLPIKSSIESKNQSNSVLNLDEVDNNIAQLTVDSHQNKLNTLDNNLQATSNNRTSMHSKEIQSAKIVTPSSPPPPPPLSSTMQQSSPPPPLPPSSTDSDSNKNEQRQITTKKDKLSGFLPNSCHNIFPFIKTKSSGHDKSNTHKDKEKEKNDTNQKDQQQHAMHQQSNNISRKILHSSKDSNKLIQNNDTAHLESEISKLNIGNTQ